MPDDQPPLKCIVISPPTPPARDALRAAIERHVAPAEISDAGGAALLVNTDATTADVRDWIAHEADAAGARVLVVAFEKWSSRGPCVDRAWLSRRGH